MKNKIIQTSNSPNLKSILFKFPSWNYELVKIKRPTQPVCGLSSRTMDNRHIICLDWDLIDKRVVIMDIMMLKDIIRPSLVFLLTTYEKRDELGILGNYMAIILDKFYFREAEQIMALTHADSIHRILANRSRHKEWVLRLSTKGEREPPRLLKVWNFGGKRENSLAHYLLLKSLYKFNLDLKNVKFDKFKETNLTFYNSASKTSNKMVEDLVKNTRVFK